MLHTLQISTSIDQLFNIDQFVTFLVKEHHTIHGHNHKDDFRKLGTENEPHSVYSVDQPNAYLNSYPFEDNTER